MSDAPAVAVNATREKEELLARITADPNVCFGNLRKNELLTLFEAYLSELVTVLAAGRFANLGSGGPIVGSDPAALLR